MRAKGGMGGEGPPRNAVVVRVTTDRRNSGRSAFEDVMVKKWLCLKKLFADG